ncbi:N-acyl homoserine lactonase family protein [Ramlibacter sp.]|uniref:N-acyl homoserine lactonase family protein n=1 Tax=Ramlibacter sp. TaxID=1917967 RepID=UPI003D103A79
MIDWSIWSFSYATGKLPKDFLSGSPVSSNQGTQPVPMIVTLLKSSDGELILVDTGFAAGESMTGRKFDDFCRSDELLRKFGVDPAQIGKLVLTHMHFDHAGNLDAFPNARIYLQRYEYESWKTAIEEFGGGTAQGKDHWAFSSLNVPDFDALERAMAQGRVELLDGDREVAPGVTCRLAKDSHTFGSQWLEVQTRVGPYALAGDVCYTFQNVERMWPPGYTQGNTFNMIREFKKMKAVAGDDLKRLVPGHDIELFTRYPSGRRDGTAFIEVALAEGHASLIST